MFPFYMLLECIVEHLHSLYFGYPCSKLSHSPISLISDGIVLNILGKLEADPRDWARLSCVSLRLAFLIRTICFPSLCCRSLPTGAGDEGDVWASLHKLSFCCPGLLHAGVLLENSDFGLGREIGPDHSLHPSLSSDSPGPPPISSTSSDPSLISTSSPDQLPVSSESWWSLFDDLYFDTVYDHSEAQNHTFPAPTLAPAGARLARNLARRGKIRSVPSTLIWHLGLGILAVSRGNAEEKRKYMLFRGVFKNFKPSRMWRTISDSNRGTIGLDCAFCACRETWDLNSFRSFFGFDDDGKPVVRAYVCENGHVSGAWTERPMYA